MSGKETDMRERSPEYYEDFYAVVQRSGAYSEYCAALFGRDFTQQGFADMRQLDRMLEILDIKPGESVLDIGCGNGRMLEYICGRTGARGVGFDVSETAIEQAKQRTKGSEVLSFEQADINVKQYADESFDAVLAVDTAYFTADLNKTVADIYRWLKPGGRLAAFYSAFKFSPEEPKAMLSPHGTAMSRALKAAGIKYFVHDFTKSHFEHMRKKRAVLVPLKARFESEGTMNIYENTYIESVDENMSYDVFKDFSTRYLYYAVKPL